jgi:GxxExxY protein
LSPPLFLILPACSTRARARQAPLRRQGLSLGRPEVYPLFYEGELAGAYVADLVVEKKIILELKSVKALNSTMEAQLLNYLRLSGIPVGYLINFRNCRMEFQRRILTET